MAVLFTFTDDDEINFQGYLSATTRGAVTRWQANFDYSFEFHTGHLTGNPIYIRPNTNRDGSNVPKFDTLNKTAADYAAISSFANGGKLGSLSNPAQADILAVVANNWAALTTLAANYWVNGPVDARDAEAIELAAWAQREMDSDTGQHFEEISADQLNAMYPRMFFVRTGRNR